MVIFLAFLFFRIALLFSGVCWYTNYSEAPAMVMKNVRAPFQLLDAIEAKPNWDVPGIFNTFKARPNAQPL